jgi:hypothetical protein
MPSFKKPTADPERKEAMFSPPKALIILTIPFHYPLLINKNHGRGDANRGRICSSLPPS